MRSIFPLSTAGVLPASGFKPAGRQLAILVAALSLVACQDYQKPDQSVEVALKGMQSGTLSDSGDFAIIGSIQHGGSLWRTTDSERLFNWNHAEKELSILEEGDFSANGEWAATTDTTTLVLWNTSSGTAERFWQAPGKILSVSLDHNGELALLGLATGSAVLFDVRRGGILKHLPHSAPVTDVELSQDGRFALTASEDQTAKFWDLTSDEPLVTRQHDDQVQLVALSPDASLALSVSQYDKALLWQTHSGIIIGEIPLGAERLKRGLRFTTAALSQDNRYLVTGRPDEIVELWEIQALERTAQWRLPKRNSWQPTGASVVDVAFGGDAASIYAIASNGFIHRLALP